MGKHGHIKSNVACSSGSALNRLRDACEKLQMSRIAGFPETEKSGSAAKLKQFGEDGAVH